MGKIHPALSEICVPQSLDPICGKFEKFLAHGQAHTGQMTMPERNYRPRQFHRTSNRENPYSDYRDMGSASLAAARPAARTATTIPLQPGGLNGKINTQLFKVKKKKKMEKTEGQSF